MNGLNKIGYAVFGHLVSKLCVFCAILKPRYLYDADDDNMLEMTYDGEDNMLEIVI